jgi:hypothetical protein
VLLAVPELLAVAVPFSDATYVIRPIRATTTRATNGRSFLFMFPPSFGFFCALTAFFAHAC